MTTKKIEDLEKSLSILQNYYAKESGKMERIKEEIQMNKLEILKLENEIDLFEKVNVLLQKTSKYAREQAKKQIESLVTNCLQYIFDTNIEFKIEIEELYGKPNAEFYVVSHYDHQVIKTKPHLSRGGGVVDIVSLALRIAFLQIHKPMVSGPVILDEPAKHVSEDFIYNVADFLKQVSEMFDRQIIMVTHNSHLASVASTAYRVSLKGSQSLVERVTG